jgi:peptide/nickel transport system permease protein
MRRYLIGRVAFGALAVLGVSLIVFGVLRLSGDPVAVLLPEHATQADHERLRARLGLDQPLPVQYLRFLERLVRADFGQSFRYEEPAARLVLDRMPATLELLAVTLVVVAVVAIPLGVLAATQPGSPLDQVLAVITLAGQSIPTYWIAIVLVLLFAVELRWLPTSGHGDLRHVILPAVSLAVQPTCRSIRLVRLEMLGILRQDFIRTARAKGLPPRQILFRHGLKNAAIPLVTLLGMDVGYLVGGAIVTETVFGWPGVGRLLIDAVGQRDFPVVQADVVIVAVAIVGVNLLVDLSYAALDPRIRLAEG